MLRLDFIMGLSLFKWLKITETKVITETFTPSNANLSAKLKLLANKSEHLDEFIVENRDANKRGLISYIHELENIPYIDDSDISI